MASADYWQIETNTKTSVVVYIICGVNEWIPLLQHEYARRMKIRFPCDSAHCNWLYIVDGSLYLKQSVFETHIRCTLYKLNSFM